MARSYRTHSHTQQQLSEIKSRVDELVRIGSLSVHRSNEDAAFDDDPVARRRRLSSPIDQRLEQLVQQLTRYQLSLAERANKVSTNFQHKVLASMLYDKNFDTIALTEAASTELKKEKEELTKAYKELGALDATVAKRIDKHIEALTESIQKISGVRGGKGGFSINDIMPLPLLRRTQHVIELSRSAENEKQDIFAPIRIFLAELASYFSNDKTLSSDTSGELSIQKDGNRIPVSQLSSGEKQLMILLTESVLQQNAPFVFLADEPELSLHIDWQAKIIHSIRTLNTESQIIIATHSPEIAGGWKNRIIDMEDVVRVDS